MSCEICHVKYWERVTQRNQDMYLERLCEEPWYRESDPSDFGNICKNIWQ